MNGLRFPTSCSLNRVEIGSKHGEARGERVAAIVEPEIRNLGRLEEGGLPLHPGRFQ